MKLKNNINLRKLGNEYILALDNQSTLDYTRVVALNEAAAYLIQSTENNEFTVESWCQLLLERYDIDKETAEKDVIKLTEQLVDANLVE